MDKRVLILVSDTGGGHRSVADAIVGAAERLFGGKYRFQVADLMADGFSFPLNRAGRMYGPVVNRLPRPWGLFWHLSNGRRRAPLTLRMVSPFAHVRLKRLFVTSKPALIVSTHPWANYVSTWLLEELGWRVPLVSVITDPVSIHHWWLCPHVDLCLVPTEQAAWKALKAGLPPDRIEVIGVPVDLDFLRRTAEKGELRKSLGLREDLFTLLLTSGGDGMGKVLPVARALAQAHLDVQLLIVTGRNESLRRRLEAVRWEVPVRILGFADNMPALMHAADLLISKAGPSTISEGLVCGLPMLISESLRGQEEGNVEWVARTGAALFTPTPQDAVAAIKDLFQPGNEALARMARCAREAAKPHSALEAARLIDELSGAHEDIAVAAGAEVDTRSRAAHPLARSGVH